MSAGIAAMSEVFTADVAEGLHARGESLRGRINAIFLKRGVGLQATGLGSMIHLHPIATPIHRPGDLMSADERVRDLLYFDLLERGQYIGRRGFMALTLALTDRDLDGFVDSLDEIVGARKAVLPTRTSETEL